MVWLKGKIYEACEATTTGVAADSPSLIARTVERITTTTAATMYQDAGELLTNIRKGETLLINNKLSFLIRTSSTHFPTSVNL